MGKERYFLVWLKRGRPAEQSMVFKLLRLKQCTGSLALDDYWPFSH